VRFVSTLLGISDVAVAKKEFESLCMSIKLQDDLEVNILFAFATRA